MSLNADSLRKYRIRVKEDENTAVDAEPPNPFVAPDALGWTYQYWNTEEKDRVFERVRTVKGAKIAGADIVPATQLYTEDYMVKFLVQNSLGATWMGMHPQSRLSEVWEYYVREADRAPVEKKALHEITFLDPACGSGHFLLEAFDLFYQMYQEEGELTEPKEICNAILTNNLFGIDIDSRAVQIAEAAIWMKAADKTFDYEGAATNLVAATASHLKGPAWEDFLTSFEKEPSVERVLRRFASTMEHIDEIGSLARPAEDLRSIIKEEHTTWEQQDHKQKEANFLFAEMRQDALSGQLPFQELSDEEFGDRLFHRAKAEIHAFTERARATGDFEDQMLATETRAGFRLVDVLSRKYDVVAANPPYMSSKSMSPTLLTYLKCSYPDAAFDLFASFIDRILTLASNNGAFACVTMQSFMFTTSYEDLRKNLLDTSSLTHLVVLGAGAFSEISGEVVSTALTIGRARPTDLMAVGMRLQASQDKSAELRSPTRVYKFLGSTFSSLPGRPFAFWLPAMVVELLQRGPLLRDKADVVLGMKTANNDRFHREWHEVPVSSRRWKRLVKSVAGCRYYSYPARCVDWSPAALHHYSSYYSAQLPNKKYWFREGVGYTDVSTSSFCAQYISPGGMSDFKANLVACHEETDVYSVVAFLNSSFARYLLWMFNPTMGYQPNDLQRLPVTIDLLVSNSSLARLGKQEVSVKKAVSGMQVESCEFCASEFVGTWKSAPLEGYLRSYQQRCEDTWLSQAELELEIDTEVFKAFGIDAELQAEIWNDQGNPVASQPEDVDSGDGTLALVRQMFGCSDGTSVSRNSHLTQRSPQRICENYLDVIAAKVGVHPRRIISIARSERINHAGLRAQAVADLVSALAFLLLGHRWPKQIEAGEAIPEWADTGGIIPLTPMTNESALFDRVQQRLRAEEIDTGNFTEVMGKTLEAWLTTEFFKHHVQQFKSRPIAWQLQSGDFAACRSPTFACLLYYHKLNIDTVPKLRSQYVGPLRQRLETELRGIMAIATEARSDRQEKRRGELDDAIVELQRLDAALESVATMGFCLDSLRSTLRQYAIDDSLLALKVRWLRRLIELVVKSALDGWLKAADRSELHPDLGSWIGDAMSHLDFHCSLVGPKPPDQKELASDPTSAELGVLISKEAESMLTGSLSLACQVWWKPLDEVVFAPLKEQIKELKAEQKRYEETLKSDPEPPANEVRELKARIKEIKADVKELNAELAEKTDRARTVRKLIEAWRSDEPLRWGKWLTEQPLFDQISSLDHRRPAPTTIADFVAQESLYAPDINDGVRVNIVPLQKAGLLAADVLAAKDLDKAISDRAEWRADERRWVREGKLPQPGWWPEAAEGGKQL